MALSAYMSLTAARQGPIEGSVTQKGREGTIEVIALTHGIVAPRDPSSGRPTGKRMHKPFSITKALDRSSPFLHFVLTQAENLSNVTIAFFRPSPQGSEKLAFTVRLHNATICSIQTKLLNTRNPRNTGFPPMEDVAFAYQRIEWVWVDGLLSADDDWEVARVV
ncbi:MAG: type VI secretion system tube protein TssD [Polyangiaceae bacterium]